jgi:hypothetical protein
MSPCREMPYVTRESNAVMVSVRSRFAASSSWNATPVIDHTPSYLSIEFGWTGS